LLPVFLASRCYGGITLVEYRFLACPATHLE
jgi:hypothetical protein